MFRVVFLTFGGSYRGDKKPHESPGVMTIPMVILAILAIITGLFNVSGGFSHFMGHGESHNFIEGFFGIFSHPLTWVSLIMAGAGVLLAYAIYSVKWLSAERITRLFAPFYTLFSHKYWFDELYEKVIARNLLLNGLFTGFRFFDSRGVDGAVNGVANTIGVTGKNLRKVQTGQLQLYGIFIFFGIVAIVFILYLSG
jgi:NADH-quinone oxidoreductase subunit L